jgi:hypothetical protein
MLKGRRIIFVLGNLELGGAERQALILARYLSEHNQAIVEVWGFNKSGLVAGICEQHGLCSRVIPYSFTEVVGAPGTQFLAPVEDADSLASLLMKLAKDPVLRARVGAENRERIREKYDSLRMCEETAALLDQL